MGLLSACENCNFSATAGQRATLLVQVGTSQAHRHLPPEIPGTAILKNL